MLEFWWNVNMRHFGAGQVPVLIAHLEGYSRYLFLDIPGTSSSRCLVALSLVVHWRISFPLLLYQIITVVRNNTLYYLIVLEAKSLKPRCRQDDIPSGGSRGKIHFLVFLASRDAGIPWLTAPSSTLKAPHLNLLFCHPISFFWILMLMPPSFKDPCSQGSWQSISVWTMLYRCASLVLHGD